MEAPPNMFRGRLVRLRAITARDWERFHEDAADTESARHHSEVPLPRSPEETRRWVEEAAARPTDDRCQLAIEAASGELVGSISVGRADRRHGTFSLGLGIFRSDRRHGYAAEAIALLLRYYFDELGYQKANAGIYAFNEPSIELHEKLGFRLEGRVRRAHRSGGALHDELLYGLTAEEFRESLAQELPSPTGAG